MADPLQCTRSCGQTADVDDEPERPRAADSSLGEVGISAALMPTSPLEGLLSSGDAQPAGLLQDYRGLFPGGTARLRKICADQEIYEVEGVDMDLGTLQPVHLDRSEVSVEPTIKFPGDYHAEETSVAAANLASYMQEDDDSGDETFSEFNNPVTEIDMLRALVENDADSMSSDSSCGSWSPEKETVSPRLRPPHKVMSNLDFPWTPLFAAKKESASSPKPDLTSSFTSVSRVKFVEDPDGFVLPAGQTPLRRELNSRSSPYRVTPHPSTGRTVMPAALIAESDAAACNSSSRSSSSSGTESSFGQSPALTTLPQTLSTSSQSAAQTLLKESVTRLDEDQTVSQLNRRHHNQKERIRRNRIKSAADRLRALVPGLSARTDKATVFEFAVHYIAYLRGLLNQQSTPLCDRDFLKKARRLMADDPIRFHESAQ